jgi:putative ABC transport system substrate-binding protein
MTRVQRRVFLAGALGTLVPVVAGAQATKIPRIGYLGNGNPTTGGRTHEAFRQGLRELGWIEGQNVTIEYRWAEGNPDRLPGLAAELVQARVDVIVLSGTPAIRAARRATNTIPIVFVSLADPVTLGVITTLARPGGNMTGVASQFEELITKQLQLLQEIVPKVSRVALLHHAEIAPTVLSEADTAARKLGITARAVKASGGVEFASAFAIMRRERAEAIHVLPSPFFNAHREQLIEHIAKLRLPAMFEFKDYVQDGGLMSYGPSITQMHRGMASYVVRIIKGAKPADLPIERATTFELVINLKTAKALGLTIPPAVLARADEVIE